MRGLAVQSQASALASLQQTTDLDRLLAWGLGADPSAVCVRSRASRRVRARASACRRLSFTCAVAQAHGAGAQPILVVMHVLKLLLGARVDAVKSGADLCAQMHQWQSSSVTEARPASGRALHLPMRARTTPCSPSDGDLPPSRPASDSPSPPARCLPQDMAEQISEYVEQHAADFCEGEHLGGALENALFTWVDASVTLVSV